MENNISVRQWLAKFNNGDFNKNDCQTQCDAGWDDWFCDDDKLSEKTIKLGKMIKLISQSSKINLDTMYVWFKNNCPMSGPLYDDFRFADMQTGEVIYTITPNSGHTELAEVYGKENDFSNVLAEGKMADVYKFFGVNGYTAYDEYENEPEYQEDDEEDNYWEDDEDFEEDELEEDEEE